MHQFFTIQNGRAAVREDALFYYGLDMQMVSNFLTDNKSGWEFFYRVYNERKYKFVFLDSIPLNLREKFKIPDPQSMLREEIARQIDPQQIQKQIIAKLKLFIEYEFNQLMRQEDGKGPTIFIGYIEQGFNSSEARLLSKTNIILTICVHLQTRFSIANIYYALRELLEENKNSNKYEMCYPLKSLRAFYNQLKDADEGQIDKMIIHGLRGRPSNHGAVSNSTKLMVVNLLSHFNNLSDSVVTIYANAVIKALPHVYNNGKQLSRSTVNNIKNGEFRNLIKAAKFGEDWIRDNLLPDVNKEPTQFALDRVEIDFTKLHVAMVNDQGKKVKKTICRIKDVKSKVILGQATGTSESFVLFQRAFRNMLEMTSSKLPSEIVVDGSSAFASREFKRIKKFLTSLDVAITVTHNPQAKGSIESHFATLLKVYLPQHIGSLGGNIATTRKHRPKKEILVLLENHEHLEDEHAWEKVLMDITNKYNSTPDPKSRQPPMEIYAFDPKPHAIHIDEKYVAFLSWHRTQRVFSQNTFKIDYDGMTYRFGKDIELANHFQQEMQFITTRTGDTFDIYMHHNRPKSIHVFERDSLKYVDKFPLAERFYGNKIDHKIDKSRAVELVKFLNERRKLARNVKELIRGISKEIKQKIGVDLNTLIKEISANENKKRTEEELMDQVIDLLRNRTAIPLDPLSGDVSSAATKGTRKKSIVTPIKLRHGKNNGQRSI